ncbi:MAG: acyl-CoA dehydrogenase family protein, partial [Candidatus Hydrogenedentes bacterium]|nr:acyl-CoA dehydrogenase family protein [Candidatus Hydrogenedentota bacterium]
MSAIAVELPGEVESARDGILAFAKKEVMPRHERNKFLFENPRELYREDGALSDEAVALVREVRAAAAKAGFYQMCVPKALGGGGLGHLAYYVAWEALFHSCGPQNWLMLYALSHWAFGPSRLLEKMTPEAQNRILPTLMDGSKSMCFGLTEPGAGSDFSMIETRAERDSEGWRITGRKIFITNAPLADFCILLAVTDPELARARRGGVSLFALPTNAPGFSVEQIIRLFGHIGGDEAELALDGVYVEPWQLVGDLNDGFGTALYGVSLGRIYNSARAIGYGRWAMKKALDHAKARKAFGSSISQYQGVTFPLAESATELHAAHLMGLNAATLIDQGHLAVKEL